MKLFTLLLTPLFVYASQSSLTTSEHNSIHGYNHRPIVKMQKKRNMHKIHKVDEEMAKDIAKKETNEDVTKLKLFHRSKLLIYNIHTKSYTLEINALDGSIISKKKKNWYMTFKFTKSPTICYCIDVDEATIVNAIKNGADSLKKVKEQTKACTGNECKEKNPKGRCCSVEIKQLLKLVWLTNTSHKINIIPVLKHKELLWKFYLVALL